MFSITSALLIDVLVRGSLLLLAALLATRLFGARPRWSRTVSRWVAAALLVLPAVLAYRVPWPLPVLPAAALVPAIPRVERIGSAAPTANPSQASSAVQESVSATANPAPNMAAAEVTDIADSTGPQEGPAAGSIRVADPADGPLIAEETEISLWSRRDDLPVLAAVVARDSVSIIGPGAAFPWSRALGMGWALVVAVLALRLGLRGWRAERWIRAAVPPDPQWQEGARRVGERLGFRRPVRVLASPMVAGPSAAGFLRGVILVPVEWRDGAVEQAREVVLAHEVTHLAGRDLQWSVLLELARIVWWFHPLAWWLPARHRLACELICDQAAADVAGSRTGYRSALAGWALLWSRPVAASALLPMADGSDLRRRLAWLKERGPIAESTPRQRSLLTAGLLLVVALIVQVEPVRHAAQGEETSPPTTQAAPPKVSPPPSAAAATKTPSPPAAVVPAESGAASGKSEEASRNQKTIHVVDEQDRPVAGASVHVQTEIRRDNTNFATPITLTTDERGDAFVAADPAVDRVFLSVKAEGYSEFTAQSSVVESRTVRLKKGRTVQVRARDAQGNLLPRALPLLEDSRIYGREFSIRGEGVFESPVVPETRRLLRAAAVGPDGGLLFSDLVDTSAAPKDAQGIIDLVLRPGTRLEGRVDDAVPRPIQGGVVSFYLREDVEHRIRVGKNSAGKRWVWEETALVEPDGTFVFPSLPGGGLGQLHVVVDGFLSRNPPAEELNAYFEEHQAGDLDAIGTALERSMWPVLVPLDAPVVRTTVPCNPAAKCQVRVFDPVGQPIAGAEIRFNPNGCFFGGELFIPGTEWSTADLVRQMNAREAKIPDTDPATEARQVAMSRCRKIAEGAFLRVPTDQDGVATATGLPAGREQFHVEAKGYLTPINPLSGDDHVWRGAVVQLRAGETEQVTVSMELDVPTQERELLTMLADGTPYRDKRKTATVPFVSLLKTTLTALHTAKGGWHPWSVARFGPLSAPAVDANGRSVIRFPESIGREPVDRLKVAVQSTHRDGGLPWVRGEVEFPSVIGGKTITLVSVEGAQVPTLEPSSRPAEEVLAGQPSSTIIQSLVSTPSLALLRTLLTRAGETDPEPIALLDDSRRGGTHKKGPVHTLNLPQGWLVVVEAGVRPRGANWSTKPELQGAPEAAYVFDGEGKFLARVGGGFGPSGSREDVDLLDLGTKDDWFLRVTRFEDNPPFDHRSEFYRLTDRVAPALRYSHYPNSNSWSAGVDAVRRYGSLTFEFNGHDLAVDVLGRTAAGTPVLREILWDADAKRFRGAAFQTVDGKGLYRVDETWSKDFEPLDPEPEQAVIAGGPREYDHWSDWRLVVPEESRLTVVLKAPGSPAAFDAPAEAAAAAVAQVELKPGHHLIHLQVKPNEGAQKTRIALRIDKQLEQTFEVAGVVGAEVIREPVVRAVSAGPAIRLYRKNFLKTDRWVELQATLTRDP